MNAFDIVTVVQNLPFQNLDLLSVGVTIAAIGILGFVIYINNRKSITSKSFLYLAISSSVWSVFNYLNYQSDHAETVLTLLRLLMFCAVWFAFALFQLLYVFPETNVKFPKWYKFILTPLVLFVLILTLTPLVFEHIIGQVHKGQVAVVQIGPGIILFGILVFYLVGGGIYLFIRKLIKAKPEERSQYKPVLWGLLITFTCIIALDFVLPAFEHNFFFIPLGALFIFPFVAFTFYTIYRHHLFDIRAVTVALLTFILTVGAGLEIIFSTTLPLVIFRSAVFLLVLGVSIMMNRFVETIAEQKEELTVANKGQADLIHILNHQIKGYLTKGRIIFSELLGGDKEYGDINYAAKNMLQTGLTSLTEGVSFVQGVLNASNIEAGTFTYTMQSIDLKKLVTEAADGLRQMAMEKGLDFDVVIPNENYLATGDPAQLKEAFKNLIDNSIHYTLKGGVHVSLSRHDNTFLFAVIDTGVGLSDEDKPKLFTKGGHGKDSQKINVNSTGFGLSLVKGIVEAHGGRVWAESDGPGKGSRFFIELPAGKK